MYLPTDSTCPEMSTYLNMYLTQLFTTLGQLTAGVVTTAVAVPMATFYWPQVQRLMGSKSKFD